jgi:hypothetical protein
MILRRKRKPPVTPADMQVVDHKLVVTGPEAAAHDATVARLTVRADMILEELDTVVKQMAAMLKDAIQ